MRHLLATCLAGLLLLAGAAAAQSTLTVVVEEGQHIRDIAREYLNDPNLWSELLKTNDLGSVTDVRPGMKLRIPRNQVSLANLEVAKARQAVDQANKEGAGMLAAEAVGGAVAGLDQALDACRKREWKDCREKASAATAKAQEALKLTQGRRHVVGEAKLAEMSGHVDGRKAADLVWSPRSKGDKLEEGQMVRTRSRSFADIVFPDRSHMKLAESSQVAIQSLRRDVLKRSEQSKVTLLGGAVETVLGSQRRGKSLDLQVPGVKIKSNSRKFFASRRGENVRIANYDQTRMELETVSATLTLGQNQGTLVEGGRASEVRDLLPAPQDLRPERRPIAYQGEIELRWEGVEGAVRYWVEIAAGTSSFKKVVRSHSDVRGTRFSPRGLKTGLYYWRVSAIDSLGLPGPKSRAGSFQVVHDEEPPFLAVASPREGEAVRQAVVEVTGETEPGTVLSADGVSVEVSPEGRFSFRHTLAEDEIVFEGRDDAGNEIRLVRKVVRWPAEATELRFDEDLLALRPGHFLTRGPGFLLRGVTVAGAAVRVAAAGGETVAEAVAGDDGAFAIRLDAGDSDAGGSAEYVAVAVPLLGDPREERFRVELDEEPPELRLDQEPPEALAERSLQISGSAAGAAELVVNGRSVDVAGGRFTTTLDLAAGANRLLLEATDRAGNTSRLERRVVVDDEAPEMVSYKVTALARVGPGAGLRVEIAVHDASALRRTAELVVDAGGRSLRGILELDASGRSYEGLVYPLPEGAPTHVRVRLRDVRGNGREYELR